MGQRRPIVSLSMTDATRATATQHRLEEIFQGRVQVVTQRSSAAAVQLLSLNHLPPESTEAVIAVADTSLPELTALLRDHPHLDHVVAPALLDHRWDTSLAAILWRMIDDSASSSTLFLGNDFRGRQALLRDSSRRQQRVDAIEAYARRGGATPRTAERIRDVAEELLSNAFYSAAAERAGRPVERTERILLPVGTACRVLYGFTRRAFFLSVRDPYGTLRRERMVEVLSRCAGEDDVPLDESRGGSGLGLWRVFSQADLLLIQVYPGASTEVLAGFEVQRVRRSASVRGLHLFFRPEGAVAPTDLSSATAETAPSLDEVQEARDRRGSDLVTELGDDSSEAVLPRITPPSRAPAPRGTHVVGAIVDGRYELEQVLEQGGMGRVYKARHRELGRSFALKLVLDDFKGDDELRELFFKEARLASSLDHRNIVSVTDFGLDRELGYFLVMELLRGETLRQRMSRQRIIGRLACDVIDQAAGALRYIHQRGVVHCDLKPENVFLAQVEGEPRRKNLLKLLDFGLSWKRDDPEEAKFGGTPPYVAPERLEGRPPTPLSDVYALGVLFYELTTGQRPYEGRNLMETIEQQLHGAPPPPPAQCSDDPLAKAASGLILRALARDPAARPASAEALLFELRTLMTMQGMRLRKGPTVAGPTGSQRVLDPALVRSPLPIAVFERAGGIRIANPAFRELMGDLEGEAQALEDLPLVRLSPEIKEAFVRARSKAQPAQVIISTGEGHTARRRLLHFEPRVRDGRTSSVHATLIDAPTL